MDDSVTALSGLVTLTFNLSTFKYGHGSPVSWVNWTGRSYMDDMDAEICALHMDDSVTALSGLVTVTFNLSTFKYGHGSPVSWASILPICSFLRPSVLGSGSDTGQTDRRIDGRRPSTLNDPTLWG